MIRPNKGSSPFDRKAGTAFLLYLALSLCLFGRALVGQLSTAYIGRSPDAPLLIWFIAWWAYALSHAVNPFLTKFIWAPTGVNLAWATNLAFGAWLVFPVTRGFGPIVSYNLLCLLSPALSGWAIFILCRYVVRPFWPAFLAGLVFSFSPYMLSRIIGTVELTLVWPVPLAIYVLLRVSAGELGRTAFVGILTLLLAVQFLIFPEVLASLTLFGVIALGLSFILIPALRPRLRAAYPLLIWSYILCAIMVSPYLYYMFRYGVMHIFSPPENSLDLASLFVPTSVNQLGILPLFGQIAQHFSARLSETGAFLAPSLLLVLLRFRRQHQEHDIARFLICMLAIVLLLSLGPRLLLAGRSLLPLPYSLIARLPLIGKALPARFMMYSYLIIALIFAIWLSEETSRILRWTIAIATFLFMMPNLSASYWVTAADLPPFISSGRYRHYLSPGETVLVLPFARLGEGMLWQAMTNMYFRMSAGYALPAPVVPKEESRWPIVSGLYEFQGVPHATDQLKAYLAGHNIHTILVGSLSEYAVSIVNGRPTAPTWLRLPTLEGERSATNRLLSTLGVKPLDVGAIRLYHIPPQTLEAYKGLTAAEMERRAARARFEALLLGARRYLADGHDAARLSPQELERDGTLALDWFGGAAFPPHNPNPLFWIFHSNSLLYASGQDLITVGIEGSYSTVEPIIHKYAPFATTVFFPYPQKLSPPSKVSRDQVAMLAISFERAALDRAASSLRQGDISETNEPPRPAICAREVAPWRPEPPAPAIANRLTIIQGTKWGPAARTE